MTCTSVSEYRLSPAAQIDLDQIWDYTAEIWSVDQAETYLRGLHSKLSHLCEFPLSNRERVEIKPPVRISGYERHLIIYRAEGDHIAIIRVAHNRSRWQALLSE